MQATDHLVDALSHNKNSMKVVSLSTFRSDDLGVKSVKNHRRSVMMVIDDKLLIRRSGKPLNQFRTKSSLVQSKPSSDA